MDENFSLKWNNFKTNIVANFGQLRNNGSFKDVTLVSDDQHTISAHRVVLSASSEYFNNILSNNFHSHPMLCLEGVSFEELGNVVDYIYYGEIQVST